MTAVFQLQTIFETLNSLLLPIFRASAFLIALPVLMTTITASTVKVMLAVGLGLMAAPFIQTSPPLGIDLASLLIVFNQLIIGILMGFALRIVMGAITMAGQVIAQLMGLGFAALQDPTNGVQVPMVSQFYSLMFVLLFFALNGHLVVIEVFIDSFSTFPVAGGVVDTSVVLMLIEWSSMVFTGALSIALPSVTTLLMVNFAFAVMTRAAPQLNIFVVGFPITLMLGFVIMLLTLPAILEHFSEMMFLAFEVMRQLAGA